MIYRRKIAVRMFQDLSSSLTLTVAVEMEGIENEKTDKGHGNDNHPNAKAIALDIFNANQRQEAIKNATIVISMLSDPRR